MSIIIGIDPGQKGAIARLREIDKSVPSLLRVETIMMPITGKGKHSQIDIDRLRSFVNLASCVYIEKVHSMPKQGVASTFKFGKGVGILLGVCGALGLPVVEVLPTRWKKAVLKDINWKGNKQASVQYVQQKYPGIDLLPTPRCRKPSDGKADAICIAEYGRLENATANSSD